MFIIERRFSLLFVLGLLTTMIKSCSALGPNLRVIRLVSSLDMGFSMYQASCLISEFTMLSDYFLESSFSRENGSSGWPNFSLMDFLLNWKLLASIESSTICSEEDRLQTFRFEPRSLPGKKVL